VFQLYTGQGEYLDCSDPRCIHRESFSLGGSILRPQGFFITDRCEGCRTCVGVCPQDAIDFMVRPFAIRQERCLHCGSCQVSCPYRAIEKLS
jgi:MinD superfamily P-loop ATPase